MSEQAINTIEKNVSRAGRQIGIIKLTRDERTGETLLFIKSDMRTDALRVGNNAKHNFGGVSCYKSKQSELTVDEGRTRVVFNYSVPDQLQTPFYDQAPIAAPIMACSGLTDGVTFNLGVIPLPPTEWKRYLRALRSVLVYIYMSYCKPLDMTITLTTEERLPETMTAEPTNA